MDQVDIFYIASSIVPLEREMLNVLFLNIIRTPGARSHTLMIVIG